MQIQFGKPLQPRPERAPPSMTLPLIVGGLVQFAVTVTTSRASDQVIDPAADPVDFLARVLGSALPVGLVLWFGFGRRRDPRSWWKIPAVLLPVALVANLIVAGRTLGDRGQAIDSISRASERMIESDGRDVVALKHSGATGEAGEMERVMLEYLRIVASKRRVYEEGLVQAGVPTLLDPQTLSRDPGQRCARAGLVSARATVRRSIADQAMLPQEFRRIIEGAAIGRDAREDALAGLDEGFRRNAPRTRRIHNIDVEILAEMEAALDILRDARWRASARSFEFERDSDAAAYNRRYERIQALSSEQERLVAEQNSETLSRLRGLR